MFDATRQQFQYIEFQTVDIKQDPAQAQKYGINRIPRLVYLDGNGKPLAISAAPRDQAGFANLINKINVGDPSAF